MTEEELDIARADEAKRRAYEESGFSPSEVQAQRDRRATIAAARLAREGWKPTDPLLIEAREAAALALEAAGGAGFARDVRPGLRDDTLSVQAALIALKRRDGVS